MHFISLKSMCGSSRYNTTPKLSREEIVEWIFLNPNFKPSYVSSDTGEVLNPESNQKEVFPKI